MDEERKKAYLSWAEKGSSVLNTMQVFQTFYETDQVLVECEKGLSKVGLGTGYTSKLAIQEKLVEDRAVLYEYVWTLLDYVETKIDKPLCENFRLHATEEISRIRLDDFEVDNTLGITETVCVMRDGKPIRQMELEDVNMHGELYPGETGRSPEGVGDRGRGSG